MRITKAKKQKIAGLDKLLSDRYGPQGWWPTISENGEEPVYHVGNESRILCEKEMEEIIIGAMLAQNTSWKNAFSAIINLKKKNLLSFEAIAKSSLEFTEAIYPARYYNQKSERIKKLAVSILKKKGVSALSSMSTHKLRDCLLSQTGIGPETADSILCYAFFRPVFVVDAYTKRIFHLIGIVPDNKKLWYKEYQDLVHASLPRDPVRLGDFHARIVRVCAGGDIKEIEFNI